MTDVEGMTEINDKQLEIKSMYGNNLTVKIDSTDFSNHTGKGYLKNLKVPEKKSYLSWKESLVNPTAKAQNGQWANTDFTKPGR